MVINRFMLEPLKKCKWAFLIPICFLSSSCGPNSKLYETLNPTFGFAFLSDDLPSANCSSRRASSSSVIQHRLTFFSLTFGL
ncbi:hypothetical protein L1987_73959 [Smallanthus sonchifolius]|uniref:Uncharacterized protein n=1 Tax=Smallanthus sonchifolius TaxID=185202 RepID=A0ACB9A2A5_9ASTR|nr:hypothetical protein L1987_73959 [Smallanthus sonchifolius]